MPIREYECPDCQFRVERLELTPDPSLPICERCEKEIGRRVEMTSVVSVPAPANFVGDGWCRPSTYSKPVRGTDV